MPNVTLMKLGENCTALYNAFIDSIDEETGEVDLAASVALDKAQAEFEKKAVDVATVVRLLDQDASAYKAEADRLAAIAKQISSRRDWLKQYLADALIQAGYEKGISGMTAKISFRTSEETIIDDAARIPDDLMKVVTTYTPDKTAIKAAIKAAQAKGETFEGAHINTKLNIQIK